MRRVVHNPVCQAMQLMPQQVCPTHSPLNFTPFPFFHYPPNEWGPVHGSVVPTALFKTLGFGPERPVVAVKYATPNTCQGFGMRRVYGLGGGRHDESQGSLSPPNSSEQAVLPFSGALSCHVFFCFRWRRSPALLSQGLHLTRAPLPVRQPSTSQQAVACCSMHGLASGKLSHPPLSAELRRVPSPLVCWVWTHLQPIPENRPPQKADRKDRGNFRPFWKRGDANPVFKLSSRHASFK